jgi:hypothetical protein
MVGGTGAGVSVDELVKQFHINEFTAGPAREYYRFYLRSFDDAGDCPLPISLESQSYLAMPSNNPYLLAGRTLNVTFEKSSDIPHDMSQRDFNRVVGCNSSHIFPIMKSAIHEITTKRVSPDKGCKTIYIAQAKSDFSDVVPRYLHLFFPVDENEVERVRRFLEEDYWMTIARDDTNIPRPF